MRRKPEDRYRAGTSDLAKWMGKSNLFWQGTSAPEKWEKGLEIGTAGGFRQFFPRNLPEGRPEIFYKIPVKFLTKTFMGSGFRETPEEIESRKRGKELELEGGSEAFKLRSDAQSFIAPFITDGMRLDNPEDKEEIHKAAIESYPDNRQMIDAVRRILKMPSRVTDYLPSRPKQRGQRMLEILKPLNNTQAKQKMMEWYAGRKLTPDVVRLNEGLREYLPLLEE